MNAFNNNCFKMHFYVNFTSLRVPGYQRASPKVKGLA